MRKRALLGWLWVFAILVAGGVQAGEPGSNEAPTVEQKAVEAPAPAPAAAPQPEAESPMPMVNEEQPAESGKCTVTCYRPVWKTRDVNCTRRVCKYRDETRTCKVPVYTQEQRSRTVICWKTECVTEMHTVTSCQNVVDECGRCCPQMVTCEVPYWDTEEFTCTQQYCEMEPYEVEVRPQPCCVPCCPPPCCPPPCGPMVSLGCSTCN